MKILLTSVLYFMPITLLSALEYQKPLMQLQANFKQIEEPEAEGILDFSSTIGMPIKENENPSMPDPIAIDFRDEISNATPTDTLFMYHYNHHCSNFRHQKLIGSTIIRTIFSHSHFKHSDFFGSIISYCIFKNSSLRKTIFINTNLSNSNFIGCNFTQANLESTTITNCSFENSTFCGANLSYVTFKGRCSLRGTTIDYHTKGDIEKLIRLGAVMIHAKKDSLRPLR